MMQTLFSAGNGIFRENIYLSSQWDLSNHGLMNKSMKIIIYLGLHNQLSDLSIIAQLWPILDLSMQNQCQLYTSLPELPHYFY